ncbi:MAG TPA: hypothetical protein VH436_23100 [Vicinamibacterales bacterium]|jgi:hypothetical protein
MLAAVLVWGASVVVSAQFTDFAFELDHPAVQYRRPATADPVASLNATLQSGQAKLAFETRTGYLRPLLDALHVSVDSQIAVFSKTSLQSGIIDPSNPRTIFFNDSVAVAWMNGGFIEVAAQDPKQGAVFYTLAQAWSPLPQLRREDGCLRCHYAAITLGVPGFLANSIPSGIDGKPMPWLGNYVTDHRSPLEERWGGWYVTGRVGTSRHLGNAPIKDKNPDELTILAANLNLPTLSKRFDTSAYLSPHSDVVALLVFDHQVRMMNLLTRIGWEARVLAHDGRSVDAAAGALRNAAAEVVDYMLFVDEAPLTGVQGSTGFAKTFSAQGPRDSKGRSLRDFDLQTRVFRYPCSYLIYSRAFDELLPSATQAIYARMSEVLSGREAAPKYAKLSSADRQAIIDILRDTKIDLTAAVNPRRSQP